MQWAEAARQLHPFVRRIGVFRSYARGDAGVGSDLDLVIIVEPGHGDRLFDTVSLPVPADVVVFDTERWGELSDAPTGLARTIAREVRWI